MLPDDRDFMSDISVVVYRYDKIKAIIDNAPDGDLITIAAYYLKNIILLQTFPDANHRTALFAVELFLHKNGHHFDYSMQESEELQKDIYSLRYKIYGTYEEMNISILSEDDNEINDLCKKFIEIHLT